jgi:hypothetical protein
MATTNRSELVAEARIRELTTTRVWARGIRRDLDVDDRNGWLSVLVAEAKARRLPYPPSKLRIEVWDRRKRAEHSDPGLK